MGSNPTPDLAQQQHGADHGQYFLPILLALLHGYYSYVRHDGWLDGAIGFLKETVMIIIIIQFCFGNYYASYDNKRHIAERNVRRATHAATIAGIILTAFGLFWGCYVLATHDVHSSGSDNAFDFMNNRVYLVTLMTLAFIIQLFSSKPGVGELKFLKYTLRYPWRFIWPTRQKKMFQVGGGRH